MDEAELISDVINGADRYEELVTRYHVGLIIHCDRLVRDRDQAEDMAQEAFIKAYLNLKNYNPEKSRFSTWLYKIATNQCIDYLRKEKNRVSVEDIESIAEATMPIYQELEEREAVKSAVLSLMPPEYRAVVEAYYWQGKSYQQIAGEMNKPVNTVRTWLRRAKLQLREELS